MFILFGIINLLALRDNIQEIILFNYPEDSLKTKIISTLIKFSYALAMLLTFPLKFFPAVVILENTEWYKKYFISEFSLK